MKTLLFPAINLLPGISIVTIVTYFYFRKRLPGLLLILIAYLLIVLVTAFTLFAPRYLIEKGYSANEMLRWYPIITIASFVEHTLLAVGLTILLNRHPGMKKFSSPVDDNSLLDL